MASSEPPLSFAGAVVTNLKGLIGAAILALPHACSRVRLAVAIPALGVVAGLSLLAPLLLVQCMIHLSEEFGDKLPQEQGAWRDLGLGPLGEVGQWTYGTPAVILATAGMLSAQLGVCACYIAAIVNTLGKLWAGIPAAAIRCGLCGLLFVLCLVRQLRNIAWLSFLALSVYLYVFFLLLKWGCHEWQTVADDAGGRFLPARWEGLGTFLGTAMFGFAGIFVSQHLYGAMQSSDPRAFTRMMVVSYVVCFAAYLFMSCVGYIAYGDSVDPIIYLSFPPDSPDVAACDYVVCLVLLLSYVVQIYPVFLFMDRAACRKRPSETDAGTAGEADGLTGSDGESEDGDDSTESSGSARDRGGSGGCMECFAGLALQWTVIAFTFVVATIYPDAPKILGYTGALSYSVVHFMMPAAFHIKVFLRQLSLLEWAGDIALLLTGVATTILGFVLPICQDLGLLPPLV